ncbi:hypothetical protein MMC11_005974 [Xylographa trunciseda]|nr:hypothetical protein [Xylographa trunciseda]
MEDEEYVFGSIPTDTSRKRTHDQFAADDTRSQPHWISDFPTSVSNNINMSASSTNHRDNRLPIARYAGDGLDFRRPIMSEPADLNFIDLTEEPDTPPQVLNRPGSTTTRAVSTRASRLPRFSRDVIDLEEEEDDEVELYEVDDETQRAFNDAMGDYGDTPVREESPGFEILSEHSIRPPTPPTAGLQGAASYVSQLRPSFPRLPPSWRGTHPNTAPGTFSLRNFFRMNTEGTRLIDAEERERQQHPLSFYRRQNMAQFHAAHIHQLIDDSSPADPTARFEPPGALDFDIVPFNIHHNGPTVPPLPTYEAPPPPRPGFTRSAAETDIVVCPNCNEELGIGDDEIKRQVWVVKKCGHVYCGICTKSRHKPKGKHLRQFSVSSPFSHCVVEGCGKSALGQQKCWVQLYI